MTENEKVTGATAEAPAEEIDTEKVTEEAETDDTAKSENKSKKDKKSDKAEIKKLKAELEETQKALEEAKKSADENNDKYMRVAAEYENFRKRSVKEKEAVYGDAVSDTVMNIVPILDNLQIAYNYRGGDSEKFAEGVEMILSKVPATLEKLGITQIGAVGDKFDPKIHNAVMHVEDESYGENEIIEVFQIGYMHGDKLIREAMVKVAN